MTALMVQTIPEVRNSDSEQIEKDYQETRGLIGGIVKKIKRMYGGDYHDLMADADEYWWLAYCSYDPCRGANLKTWIYWQVWGRLTIDRRQERVHNIQINNQLTDFDVENRINLTSTNYGKRRSGKFKHSCGSFFLKTVFDLEKLLDELSPEAQHVICLVVDVPVTIIKVCGGKKYHERKRKAVIKYLRENGWDYPLINKVFQEIAEALQQK